MRCGTVNGKSKTDKQVVGLKEVDQVIAVMGQPEDYIIEEDNHDTHSYSSAAPRKQKNYTEILKKDDQRSFCRTYHYFGIDAVWVRILFILVWGAGTGVLAYIILWIVVPAVTTSEKLEMTGEPVNISNIEKKEGRI
jgi:hypothetical protein